MKLKKRRRKWWKKIPTHSLSMRTYSVRQVVLHQPPMTPLLKVS